MKTWFLYILWLLMGGKDTSAADNTDTESTVSRGEDRGLDDDLDHDGFDYDDVGCDAFEFDDSGLEDFESDEGFLH